MNKVKVGASQIETVRTYIQKKFEDMNSAFYPSYMRRGKCIAYYLAAQGTPWGQMVIKEKYLFIYREAWPHGEVAAAAAAASAGYQPRAHNEKHEARARISTLTNGLERLRKWERDQSYQEGPDFFNQLKATAKILDEDGRLCNESNFKQEFAATWRPNQESSSSVDSDGAVINFEGLLGIRQKASVCFEANSPNWGEINSKLEQSFKAGAWGQGSAKAKMTKLGLSVEAQASIAIGAQLEVTGDLLWQNGKVGLELGGAASVFGGARAGAEASLSLSARQGIEAAFSAEAFVGFEAKVEGQCSFSYDGNEVFNVKGGAGIAIGIGGKLTAGFSAPIFGPNEISIETEVAFGLGIDLRGSVGIDFSQAGLAAGGLFQSVIYFPTLLKGYQNDLNMDNAKNLHYLNKSIKTFEAEIDALNARLLVISRMPPEKQSLLSAMDDDDD